MTKTPKVFEDTQALISQVCDEIKALLLKKNADYGNSVTDPVRIFAKADTVEQIHVRIDDKLSRIRTMGPQTEDEDTVQDLIGYLVLLRVAKLLKAGNSQEAGVLAETTAFTSGTRPGDQTYAVSLSGTNGYILSNWSK